MAKVILLQPGWRLPAVPPNAAVPRDAVIRTGTYREPAKGRGEQREAKYLLRKRTGQGARSQLGSVTERLLCTSQGGLERPSQRRTSATDAFEIRGLISQGSQKAH